MAGGLPGIASRLAPTKVPETNNRVAPTNVSETNNRRTPTKEPETTTKWAAAKAFAVVARRRAGRGRKRVPSALYCGNGAMPGAALSGKLRRVVFITIASKL